VAPSKWKHLVGISSIDEVEESTRGEQRPAAMSLNTSIMSTVTEDAVWGRRVNAEGREDSEMHGDACLQSPRPQELEFLLPPRVIETSTTSGQWATKRGEEGDAATLAMGIIRGGQAGASMVAANCTCLRENGTGAARS